MHCILLQKIIMNLSVFTRKQYDKFGATVRALKPLLPT